MALKSEAKKLPDAPAFDPDCSKETSGAELAGHLRDVVSAAKCIATLVEHIATKIDSKKQTTPTKEEVKG